MVGGVEEEVDGVERVRKFESLAERRRRCRGKLCNLLGTWEKKTGGKGKKETRKTMVNMMQGNAAKITIDKRVYENKYVFTVVLIVKTKQRLSECTVVNVSELTKPHSHSWNLSDIVCVSAIEFEMHELRSILEDNSPVVPLDPRPGHVVVASFR